MAYLDKQIEELDAFLPPLTRRPDFMEFWRLTLEKTRQVPLQPHRQAIDYPNRSITVYDIHYCGFDETPIHGWLILPFSQAAGPHGPHGPGASGEPAGPDRPGTSGLPDPVPCLIHYHGFTGNRGQPADFMHWVGLGLAVLSVDCRDQSGATGNRAATSGGSTQSVACRGILDKNEYYFRAAYMDCLKAIDFAVSQPEINADRIIIEGGSQGGALGMAVCALDARPWLAMVDVPSNSLLEERVINAQGSFSCITDYLKIHPDQLDQAFATLSYFDTMNMAEMIRCPLLASVALKDQTCPARNYYASYNRIRSPKEIRIYPFNGHEGGHSFHTEVKIAYLARHLASRDGDA